MIEYMMNLRTLVEKLPDADILREMIGLAGERLMELEVGTATGAGYGEKSHDRLAQRNGLSRAGLGDAGPAPSSCASPSYAKAAISLASWSRAAWPKRR